MDNFLNDAVNTAAGILLAVFAIVLIAWFFHDMVFGMIADMHKSWKRHFRD